MAQSSSHRHSIGPHTDLPTITEDFESEEEDFIDDDNLTEEDDDDFIIDDNQSDSGSKVSYANSYAFTLDGVGFDEENSLISGICNGSVVHEHEHHHLTPPQNSRLYENERELKHREACRELGIPWSSANSDSDRGSDHDRGGAAAKASALNAKKGRIKANWPWPEMGGKMSTPPPILDNLDANMRNYALSNTDGAKKRRRTSNDQWRIKNGGAFITTLVLIAICLIGILVTAFTSKSNQNNHTLNSVEAEVVVMEGQPRTIVNDVDISIGTASTTAETSTHKTKAGKEHDTATATSSRVVDDGEEEADCITNMCSLELSTNCLLKFKVKKTPVATLTIHLMCAGETWIGIGFSNDGQMIGSEAVLGTPGEMPQKYVLGGKDNSSVMPMEAQKQTLMDASVQVTRRGLTVMKFTKIMKEEGEIEIKSGENTFLYAQGMGVDVGYHASGESFTLTLPDVEESEAADTIEESIRLVEDTPSEEDAADGQDTSCVDQPGKFTTSTNKNRSCLWLSKSDDALHSSLQDRECGIQALGTQPSELGLNCRYTCRAYNGCLFQGGAQDAPNKVDMVQPSPIDELIFNGGGATGVAVPCTIDVCNLELSHTCLLKYKVNIPTIVTPVNTVTIELICEGKTWIGIGFSNDGQMVGSEAVLGTPGEMPQKYVLGGKDNSSVMPMAAHRQTLMDASVEFESGLTIMKFTKIMKEEGEVEIKSGENIFLYAQGMGVDVGYHASGESFTLSLPGAGETSVAAIDTSTETPLAGDTFIDATKGLFRSCLWLDIRNWGKLLHS
jgi:hypothetical protein